MALEGNIILEESRVIIKSNQLNIDSITDYDLNLFLSPYEFGFSIIDPTENRCLRLEYVVFKDLFVAGKTDDVLLKIFQDNPLLPAGFWKKINLFLSNRCFTFIPNEFYTPEDAEEFLKFNCKFDSETHTCQSIEKDNFHIVFGVEKALEKLLKKIYPSREVHFYPHVLNLIQKEKENETVVYLYQDHALLTLVAYKNGNFVYCNTFIYKNTDDALYYCLLVFKELNFDAEAIQTIIAGSVENQNILQARLKKYIRNVGFRNRPQDIKLCYNFDEIADNRFFNLLNIQINE